MLLLSASGKRVDIIKKITILLFSMIVYGCADSTRIVQDARYDTIKLSSNASVYVSVVYQCLKTAGIVQNSTLAQAIL